LCTFVHLGYDKPIPIYCCRPFQAHGLNCCEVWVEIPVDPMALWTGVIVRCEVDDAVKKMAHMALTALCERRLTNTTDMMIVLFPIREQCEPKWRQRLEATCDLSSP
jgi:hypothetical protein